MKLTGKKGICYECIYDFVLNRDRLIANTIRAMSRKGDIASVVSEIADGALL
jgi:hypothetical protein